MKIKLKDPTLPLNFLLNYIHLTVVEFEHVQLHDIFVSIFKRKETFEYVTFADLKSF